MGVLEGNSGSSIYVGADSSNYNSATVRIKGLGQPANNYDGFGVYYQIGSGSWDGWSYVTLYNSSSSYETSTVTINGLPPNTRIYFVARANFRGTWYYGGETYLTTPSAPTPSTPTLSIDGVTGKSIRVKVVTGSNTSQVYFAHYESMSFGRYNTLNIGSNTTYYYNFDVPNYSTTYNLDCQAISPEGNRSSWSAKLTFSSGVPTPQISSVNVTNVEGKNAYYLVRVNESTTEVEMDYSWLGAVIDRTEVVNTNDTTFITVTAPSYGEEYSVDFRPRNSSIAGNWTGFIKFRTRPLPVTNLRVTGREKTSITVAFSSSSQGAVKYLCKAFDVLTGSQAASIETTNTIATLTGLTSGREYSLVVWSVSKHGDLDSDAGTKIRDFTRESIAPEVYMEVPTGNTKQITVIARAVDRWSGIDYVRVHVSHRNSTAGWSYITKYPQNVVETENLSFIFTNDGNGLPFQVGETYYFKAEARDKDGNIATTGNYTFVPKNARPVNFSWNVSWVTGQPFSLKASQWNKFTQTVNDFKVYKNQALVSFPTVVTGGILTAAMYNQARTAISEMGGTGLPPAVSKGDRVTPYTLNQIVNALNSIP
ncbi:hypothetical protein vBBak6_044 [Bacillus phage v_B-Bak6]|nr:hypothetical protein vBBak6_044 [Bacillus phage v_B-Bak6]